MLSRDILIDKSALVRMREWRHFLHAHPEIAYKEDITSDFVAERLTEMGIEVERGLAGTGVIGILQGTASLGRSIGLRAELDALPITEKSNLSYRSANEGVMHACGHDGHMAMLLGAADYLSNHRSFSGTVVFIFQPAEENEGGAVRMIEEGLFEKYPVDAIYALHNWPGLPTGCIVVHPGPMMAQYDIFEFTIIGCGGHSAMPQDLRDPTVAAGQLINAIQTIVARDIDPFEQGVISVTRLEGGNAFNVVPDVVTVGGSVRTFEHKVQLRIRERLLAIAEGIGAALDVRITLNYECRFFPTINSAREATLAQRAACRAVDTNWVEARFRPSMASEDFSAMLMERPGAFAWIGSGEGPGLHQSSFDFNDALLQLGATYLIAIVDEELVTG
ncbi:amidohydrolase (plasmid) [Rhizobium lusitanum]|uniref:M20 aminoacylase family protein n=1 Tax=Rhizobium lusitanum TaxID=293958 RepID=UPI0016124097|nr:M20 aminoacylase family protein [Rhizobium lusitanum]QND44760.1 amidohydrolase [Rhizobium lusitanum]